MQNNFLFLGVVVVVVAVLTSVITLMVFQDNVLYSPDKEGQIEITGGIDPGVVNVIIIDTSVVAGVDDTVSFSVSKNEGDETDSSGVGEPPFVIRNIGNDPANIKVYAKTDLFDYKHNTDGTGVDGSYVKYWFEQASPIVGLSGYSSLNDCLVDTGDPVTTCYVSTSCTDASRCLLPTSVDGSGVINTLNTLYPYPDHREAFLGIEVWVNSLEPIGPKSTTVAIEGSAV